MLGDRPVADGAVGFFRATANDISRQTCALAAFCHHAQLVAYFTDGGTIFRCRADLAIGNALTETNVHAVTINSAVASGKINANDNSCQSVLLRILETLRTSAVTDRAAYQS